MDLLHERFVYRFISSYIYAHTYTGPEDSVYEGGVFKMLLVFTEKYPFDPPSLRILSDFWHPVRTSPFFSSRSNLLENRMFMKMDVSASLFCMRLEKIKCRAKKLRSVDPLFSPSMSHIFLF